MAVHRRIAYVTGMPRSGTSWIAQMIAAHPDVRLKLAPLFSHELKDRLDHGATAAEWRGFFRTVYETASDYMDQGFLRRTGAVPEFTERSAEPAVLAIKSTRHHHLTRHLLAACDEISWLGVVRHPCGAIHSWLSNPLEFPPAGDPASEWRSGRCRKTAAAEFWGFDDWMTVTSMFVDLATRHPDRFMLLHYERFVADAEREIRPVLARIGLDLHPQVTRFVRDSQARHSPDHRSVFKLPAVADRWRTELDPGIRTAIEAELSGSPLARLFDPPGGREVPA